MNPQAQQEPENIGLMGKLLLSPRIPVGRLYKHSPARQNQSNLKLATAKDHVMQQIGIGIDVKGKRVTRH